MVLIERVTFAFPDMNLQEDKVPSNLELFCIIY